MDWSNKRHVRGSELRQRGMSSRIPLFAKIHTKNQESSQSTREALNKPELRAEAELLRICGGPMGTRK
ncbi:hypothetical protein SAY87_022682 [Trapa incisa]|uniref:Uncharacterized protein n=1 Tax=Trapa incisa TaxID=236973 RepID=A0AAN7K465_9MYRT|nr:hypothetical protein SAY87_022682 [Trapa incisa]